MNILISACLLGIRCRYDGAAKYDARMEKLMEKHHLIPVCPEIYGGLSTPRAPSERVGDKVMGKNGQDVTEAFQKGAEETLALAKLFRCKYAILKERQPILRVWADLRRYVFRRAGSWQRHGCGAACKKWRYGSWRIADRGTSES